MNEKEFGEKMKPWLERAAAGVGEMQATRLRAARLRALDACREPERLFGLVRMSAGQAQMIRYAAQRALLFIPLAALLAVLALQSVSEGDLGELDAQLLTQELPPDAFLDKEFRSWLGKSSG